MGNEKEYFESLPQEEKFVFAYTRWFLFCQWQIKLYASVKHLFAINDVDTFMQDIFYIKLHGYLNEGYKFLASFHKIYALYLPMEFSYIVAGLKDEAKELKQIISKEEESYIEYRRHTATHLFQSDYDIISATQVVSSKKVQKQSRVNIHIESKLDKYKHDDLFDLNFVQRVYNLFEKYSKEHDLLLNMFSDFKEFIKSQCKDCEFGEY